MHGNCLEEKIPQERWLQENKYSYPSDKEEISVWAKPQGIEEHKGLIKIEKIGVRQAGWKGWPDTELKKRERDLKLDNQLCCGFPCNSNSVQRYGKTCSHFKSQDHLACERACERKGKDGKAERQEKESLSK